MSYEEHIKDLKDKAKTMTLNEYFDEFGRSMDIYEMWVSINKERNNAR